MKNKKLKKRKKRTHYEEVFQDENFYFIAGYTSGGTPYGTTWEEAYTDGLVEKEGEEQGSDSEDEYPF